jgi:hypothetical protein
MERGSGSQTSAEQAGRGSTREARHVERPCGHRHHVGTCPPCQRAQLASWHAQLEEATLLSVRTAAA